MKELDRIKIVEHFNFELFSKGSDLGRGFGNNWSLSGCILNRVRGESCLS